MNSDGIVITYKPHLRPGGQPPRGPVSGFVVVSREQRIAAQRDLEGSTCQVETLGETGAETLQAEVGRFFSTVAPWVKLTHRSRASPGGSS